MSLHQHCRQHPTQTIHGVEMAPYEHAFGCLRDDVRHAIASGRFAGETIYDAVSVLQRELEAEIGQPIPWAVRESVIRVTIESGRLMWDPIGIGYRIPAVA